MRKTCKNLSVAAGILLFLLSIVYAQSANSNFSAVRPSAESQSMQYAELQQPPVRPPVVIMQSVLPIMLPVVFFTRGSVVIDNDKYASTLAEILFMVNEYPKAKVIISAYSDPAGGTESNAAVVMGRAIAMRRYLTSHGVDSKRISFGYMGKERDLAGVSAYSELARRVEIVLEE
jgi:outer membrane protein OmpA-like peptidoglycan-associated protein